MTASWPPRTDPETVLATRGATVWLPGGRVILDDVDWQVRAGETWALLGPNGAGKTTLLSLVSTRRFPSSGDVAILGERLGAVDVWTLKGRIGVVDQALRMPPELTVEEIVLTGKTGSVQPMWRHYDDADRLRVRELLELLDCAALVTRHPRHLSQGERGRVRIARALMTEPRALLLDEPATGLDMLAREQLLQALRDLAARHPHVAIVIVSHHVEELPGSTTHALLLRDGRQVARGPVDDALTSASISACFGGPIDLRRHDDRWQARLRAPIRPTNRGISIRSLSARSPGS
jgi:iron complex transport system ATP-binding protein